jgi:OmcA/MtrC family decaheme c-type cytochrome
MLGFPVVTSLFIGSQKLLEALFFMKKRTPIVVMMFALFFLVAGFCAAALEEGEDQQPAYSELDKAYYLTADDAVWVRPGLNVQIQDVKITSARQPVVTFRLTDSSGQPLDKDGVISPGTVGLGFIIAYLPRTADSRYVSYATRTQTSPITGVTEAQATTDSGGTYAVIGDGVYTYTYKTVLPSNYDTAATHTLGIYASRSLAAFGLSRYRANVVKNFVPSGAQVTQVRDVVRTANCNACHDPLMAHGETGREAVEICILCHTPQTKDPDTGNTVDMTVMTHKIHMGANLPSVKGGKPYQIIGYGQSVADYSTVAFPMDIRNCQACHKDSSQLYSYLLNPTRASCGSCHDDINWTTGANHLAGPQQNDQNCASCHQPDSETEYDASVKTAHIPEYKSSQLVNPKLQILSVTNTTPGQKPTVQFRLTDKNGNALDPNTMTRLSFTLAGPASEYATYVSENLPGKVTVGSNGVLSYTFTAAIPATAKGTYVIEAESYLNVTVQKLIKPAVVQRDVSTNVVFPFAVTGAVTPRRVSVDIAKCNKCHEKLQPHGSNRNTTEACVVCHNPTMTDAGSRPAANKPDETIQLANMVHKIHTGEALTADSYVIYGRGGAVNFKEVRYPGDRRDCLQCHVAGSYTVPLQTTTAVTTPRGYWTPTAATSAACLGCHDSIEAAAHALINTAIIKGSALETCETCHSESAEFAVSQAHAR